MRRCRSALSAVVRACSTSSRAAATRVLERHRTATLLGEEILDDRGVIDGVGDEDGAWHGRRAAVVLRHEGAQAVTGAEVGDALELVRLHGHDASAAHRQQRDHGPAALQRDRHAVLVGTRTGEHLLPLGDAVDGAQPVAEARGQLEIEVLRGTGHLPSQLLLECVAAALHEEVDLVEQGGVLRAVDASLAGTAAALDVVVETHPAAPEDLVAAGAERKDGAQ